MKEQNEEKNTEVSGVIAKTQEFIEKNKKALIIVACAIVAVGLGIWAYIGLIANPRQVRASEDMFAAEQYFGEGNFEQALNGNDDFLGFIDIIDEYGCTKSGNLAKLYAGICEINLGKFNEAIDHLDGYKADDIFTKAIAKMLMGDAYAELNDAANASKYYQKAAKESDNVITAPTALWKAGMMELQQGNKAKAKELFQEIKNNYPESTEWNEVDKYIALAE